MEYMGSKLCNWILISGLLVYMLACSRPCSEKYTPNAREQVNHTKDTFIGKLDVSHDVAGSSYLKRASLYFVIVNGDTSDFKPQFTENKDDAAVVINQNLSYYSNSTTYSQRLNELKLILHEAANDYDFKKLTSLSMGRLILSGDLAVTLTREYKHTFGDNEKITTADYDTISHFLLASTLAKDMNKLFMPYDKSVSSIDIEKAFFADKEGLLRYSKLSTTIDDMPDATLDFITYITFKDTR